MHADGVTLFFSSKGHENMGGFDIFSSTFDETKQTWAATKNLGYPINTADDDIYFVWSADGTRGYYSSYRNDTYGEKDLYMLTRPVKPNNVVCRITLLDSLSEKPLENATVSILTVPDQEISVRKDLNGGLFMEGIPQGKRYKYVVEAEGYLLKEGEFDAPIETSYYEVHKILKMKGFIDPKPDSNLVANNDSDNLTDPTDNSNNGSLADNIINPTDNSNNGSLANNDSDNLTDPTDNSDNGSLANNDSDNLTDPTDNSDNGSLANNDSDNLTDPTDNSNNGSLANNDSDNLTDPTDNLNDGSLANNDNGSANSRENGSEHITVPSDLETSEIFEEGSKIIYRKILFDHDKAKLRASSVQELNKFHKLMRAHPTLKVQVSGHTDEIGSRWYNKRLSKRRAKVVVKYLVKKGVNKKRFVAVGYGERKPFASNSTAEGRQLNRRTEVKVIKFIDENKYGDEKINLDDIENWNEDENKENYSNTPGVAESTSIETYEQTGKMLPIKVHFMFNVYDQLTPYSEGRLDLLVEKLTQSPSMKLKVHAHTDTQGDAQYNQQLSTLRAKTVIDYLVSKGIDSSRLEIASHGARYPLIEVQNDEGGHLYNRRVEFEVIQK
jgi:outer membrane protein OmpA-like peptidoglycan-associated protein